MAAGMNDAGDIVGSSRPSGYTSGNDRAFLYSDGIIHNLTDVLGDPDWTLTHAFAINSSGMIVGNGTFKGEERAYILIPTPEPSTLILLTAGAFGLLAFRRRRRWS